MTELLVRSAEGRTLPRDAAVPDGVQRPLRIVAPGQVRESGRSETVTGEDAVLRALPEPARRTLFAQPAEDGYRLDIVLQGEADTTSFRV